jgi:hypothetical protein
MDALAALAPVSEAYATLPVAAAFDWTDAASQLGEPAASDRSCLSFCFWTSRAEARAASGRAAHVEAVSVLGEMYERYTLEFLRVTGRAGAPLRFEPYDAVIAPAPPIELAEPAFGFGLPATGAAPAA